MSEEKDFYRQRDVSELPTDENAGDCHIECIIMHKTQGLMIRPWNMYHKCFDDSEYDDHYCDKSKVKWWSTVPHFYSDELKESLK